MDVLGVAGTAPEEMRVRAVRGVGALIRDFFGVSVRFLLPRLPVKPEDVDPRSDLEELGRGLVTFARFPADIKG